MADFIIVGAGVAGLTTALAISENAATPQDICVVSEYDPYTPPQPEYTSAWAGAHFRPFPSRNQHELRDSKYARVTFRRFQTLARENPESSVRMVKGIDYLEAPDKLYRDLAPGYAEGVGNFSLLPPDELPRGTAMGTMYDSFVLNPPVYLQFLYRRLKFKYGVRFVAARLEKLKQAREYGSGTIINCSGKGLQWEGSNDESYHFVRGQTVSIRPGSSLSCTITHQLKTGEWTFYIPRPLDGGGILGGTKQPNDGFREARKEDTAAILKRAAAIFPDLMKEKDGEKYFDVVGTNVGFRPFVEGGVNVSVEHHAGSTVINGYGLGGSGYEFSYGMAMRIVEMTRGFHKL